jgi:hypothetical protein
MNAVPIHQVVQVVAWAAFPRRGYEQAGRRAEAVGVRGERPGVAAQDAADAPETVPVAAGTAVPALGTAGLGADIPARTEPAVAVGGMSGANRCVPIVVLAESLWAEAPHGTVALVAAGPDAHGAGPDRSTGVDRETEVGYRRDRDTKPPA